MLMDMPLRMVRDVTRLLLGPSPACGRTFAGSGQYSYIKCICKYFEEIILQKLEF
jgi:hypothetical protein